MWFFSWANKYNVETQVDFFSKKISGKPLEYDRMDNLSGEMTPGDIHKVTEQDIQGVRDFIANERKNYPDTSLEPLFREWERLQKQYEEKLEKEKAKVVAKAAADMQSEREKQQREKPATKPQEPKPAESHKEKEAPASAAPQKQESSVQPKPAPATGPKESDGNKTLAELLRSGESKIVIQDGIYWLVGKNGVRKTISYKEISSLAWMDKGLDNKALEATKKRMDLFLLFTQAYAKEWNVSPEELDKKLALVNVATFFVNNTDKAEWKLPDDLKKSFRSKDPIGWERVEKALRTNDASDITHYIANIFPSARPMLEGYIINARFGWESKVTEKELQELIDSISAGNKNFNTLSAYRKLWNHPAMKEKMSDFLSFVKARDTEAIDLWAKNKDTYLALAKQQYGVTDLTPEQVEKAEKTFRKNTKSFAVKKYLMERFLENKADSHGTVANDTELTVLSDIMGVGTWNPSDRSVDISKEVAIALGIEAVAIAAGLLTAGAWTVAVNALAVGVQTSRFVRIAQIANSTGRMVRSARWAGASVVEGTGFWVGNSFVRGSFEWNVWEAFTKQGLVESIGFMGAMRIMRVLPTLPGLKWLDTAGTSGGKRFMIGAAGLTIDGGLLFGVHGLGKMYFEPSSEPWTTEEFIQCLMMAWAGRGLGMIAKKMSDGRVEMRAQQNTSTAEPAILRPNPNRRAPERNPEGTGEVTKGMIDGRFNDLNTAIKALPKGEKAEFRKEYYRLKKESGNYSTLSAEGKEAFAGRITELEARVRAKQTLGTASARTTETAGNATVSAEAIQAAAPQAAAEVKGFMRKLSDNKSAKMAWDMMTKEMQSGGLIKTSIAFPVNLMRLPAINARKIGEIWIKKTENGFGMTSEVAGKNRFLDSLKVAATASEKPFEGKTQTLANLLAMGTVAYITYKEILEANPSTPFEVVWWATWRYLKNMNITLPYEIGKIFFTKEVEVS